MQRMGAILVFDNDQSIADLLTDLLSDEGYAVRTTLDGAPARTSRPEQPPALIVLDLALPAPTVAAVRHYARSHYLPNVPVVITTTSPSRAAADTATSGDQALLKPFALDDLLVCVASYVHLPHRQTLPLLMIDPSNERPAQNGFHKRGAQCSHSSTSRL
jgi:DNA-binding response OmpR family regulator